MNISNASLMVFIGIACAFTMTSIIDLVFKFIGFLLRAKKARLLQESTWGNEKTQTIRTMKVDSKPEVLSCQRCGSPTPILYFPQNENKYH